MKACELVGRGDPHSIDTLAAAYAETGDFTKACEFAEKAIGISSDETRANTFRSRLARYRAGKPFRM